LHQEAIAELKPLRYSDIDILFRNYVHKNYKDDRNYLDCDVNDFVEFAEARKITVLGVSRGGKLNGLRRAYAAQIMESFAAIEAESCKPRAMNTAKQVFSELVSVPPLRQGAQVNSQLEEVVVSPGSSELSPRSQSSRSHPLADTLGRTAPIERSSRSRVSSKEDSFIMLPSDPETVMRTNPSVETNTATLAVPKSHSELLDAGVMLMNLESQVRELRKIDANVHGVYVAGLSPTSWLYGIVESGDVIMQVDGHDISDDGQISLPAGCNLAEEPFPRLPTCGNPVSKPDDIDEKERRTFTVTDFCKLLGSNTNVVVFRNGKTVSLSTSRSKERSPIETPTDYTFYYSSPVPL